MAEQKRALITGANSGIGLWTALGLLRAGYHVALVSRDEARGQAAQQWLQQKVPEGSTALLLADLETQAEACRLAEKLRNRFDCLDLLINNAGCMSRTPRLTADGVEAMLAVNYLAPFLLTQELLPLLQQSPAAHVINVGSASADRMLRLDLAALRNTPRGGLGAYAQSKLALLIYSFEAARRWQKLGVRVNCVHPGVVATRIGDVGGAVGTLWRLMTPFLMTPEQGARCTLQVATSQAWEEVTGRYAKRGKSVRANPQAYDLKLAEKLWELSTAMTASSARRAI